MNEETRIREIFLFFSKNNPDPKSELNWKNDFTLLVAVMLSAQSTDKQVNKVTENLFKIIQKPEDVINLGLKELKENIKSIGLYNAKAENIYKTSQILIDAHNSKVPDSIENLESLHGVGRKTANVILSVLFKKNTIAVDTHVFRVSKRLGLSSSGNVLGVEKDLLVKIPKEFLYHAHNWLILHGRYTCKAKNYNCKNCGIANLCNFEDKYY